MTNIDKMDTITEKDLNYLEETIKLYSDTDKKLLVNKLKQASIITKRENLFNSVEHSNKNNFDLIKESILKHREETLKVIEEFEIDRVYKYGAMFYIDVDIENLVLNESFENLKENQSFFATESNPTVHTIDDLYIIKFIDICKGTKYIEETQELRADTSRYPMLAIFHSNDNIFEIKVPFISVILRNSDKEFYYNKIKKLKEHLESYFNVDLKAINMYNLVSNISNDKNNKDVKVSSQKMQLASGGEATLNSSNESNETILPILGELSSILSNNDILFNKNEDTIKIKELINDFIDDTNVTSELPWVSLRWSHDTKTKRIQVKFLFDHYSNYEFTLMEFYNNLRRMEGMRYVEEYLIKKYKEHNSGTSYQKN